MKRFLVVTGALAALVAVMSLPAGASPPAAYTVDPGALSFATGVDGFAFQTVTVTTGRAVVLQNPSSITGDSAFSDTLAGSCWQNYDALGKPIPPHTSCTVQIGFHPTSAGTFNATLNVTRCVDWYKDPTYGFIVCTNVDGSVPVALTGAAS
jgi:hypothetical protein